MKDSLPEELKDAANFADSDYVDWSEGANVLRKAKSRIEELEAECAAAWDKCEERRLAQKAVEAQRDEAEEQLKAGAKVARDWMEKAETCRAAIPVAYQMALEAAASYHDEISHHDYSGIEYSLIVGIPIANHADLEKSAKRAEMDAKEIRALTPPADLVEQATTKVKGGE